MQGKAMPGRRSQRGALAQLSNDESRYCRLPMTGSAFSTVRTSTVDRLVRTEQSATLSKGKEL